MTEYPPADPSALASLGRKLTLIRDHITAVALLYKTGLFLWGAGGLGKSYTVLSRLKEIDAPYQLYNSRMTAKGLFLALKNSPEAVHVLEDMEPITKDANAQGVLRSALWAQPGHDRLVTWTTAAGGTERFPFRGSIIMISNRPLADMPELRALATRIEVYRMEATDAELAALMRDLAGRGYHAGEKLLLAPEDCSRVTEFLLKECRAAACPLDLRLQPKAYQSYRQWEADQSATHWEDVVAASVREATHHLRHEPNPSSPEERKRWRRNVLRAVLAEIPDPKRQIEEYGKRAGGSRADFFRRKREVESGEFEPETGL